MSLHAPNQALREELVPAAKAIESLIGRITCLGLCQAASFLLQAIPIQKLLAIVDDHAKKGVTCLHVSGTSRLRFTCLLTAISKSTWSQEGKRLRTVMVSYVLLKARDSFQLAGPYTSSVQGVNDSLEHAKELAELLDGRPVLVAPSACPSSCLLSLLERSTLR